MDYITINIIKNRMKELNITQLQLSEILDVTPITVSHWLSGKRTPSLSNYYVMLDVLGLQISIEKIA